MGELKQANYAAALKTPLGEDVLVLKSFSGSEGLGEPFEFQVEALSEQEDIDFDKALGQACTIRLKTYEQKQRFFCGILTNAQWVGSEVGDSRIIRNTDWYCGHGSGCWLIVPIAGFFSMRT